MCRSRVGDLRGRDGREHTRQRREGNHRGRIRFRADGSEPRRDPGQESRGRQSRGGIRGRLHALDGSGGACRDPRGEGGAPAADGVRVQELLPGEAPQPAGRQEADVLPGLRLGPPPFAASLIAAASGLILTLALPPIDLGPVAFIALVPLLWAVRRARARTGALLGLIFGLVYFGVLMSWLLPLTRLGWFVLVAGQAAFMALLFAFTAAMWREEAPVRSSLAFGAGWAAIEWARGVWPLGGFTWGGLGYTQHDNPLLLPLASLAGVWGISFVVASVNALLTGVVVRRRWGLRPAARPVAGATRPELVQGINPLAAPA